MDDFYTEILKDLLPTLSGFCKPAVGTEPASLEGCLSLFLEITVQTF